MSKLATVLAALNSADTVKMIDAEVTAIRSDGTVNLLVAGATVDAVPVCASYTLRKVGDVVLVMVAGKRWIVVDQIGPESPASSVPETVVSWGTGNPPGTGWVRASGDNVWVKKNQLFIKYAVSDPTPAPTPTPDRPVTVTVNDRAAFRDGHRNTEEDNPIQGAWPEYPHPYTGAWYYGTKIAAACSGKSVNTMTIHLVRAGRSEGGVYGGARMRLYLHGQTVAGGSTPILSNLWSPGTLEPGQARDIDLPSSWVSALASGSSRGVGCYADTGESNYLTYATSGNITIEFN